MGFIWLGWIMERKDKYLLPSKFWHPNSARNFGQSSLIPVAETRLQLKFN